MQSDTPAARNERCPIPVPDGRPIEPRTLSRQTTHLVRDHRVWSTPGDGDPAWPLEGDFGVDALPGGLVLRRARARNRHDMYSRARLSPCVKIVLLLGGSVDVRFGERVLRRHPADAAHGAVVHLSEDTPFERHARRGTWEQSVTLTVPFAWLDERLGARFEGHWMPGPPQPPRLRTWQPGDALLARCDALFGDRAGDMARRLECESIALAMVAEVLPVLADPPAGEAASGLDERRVHRLRAVVESRAAERMTLDRIASAAGMSPSSLQRHFRAIYGTSVQRYLRRRRLESAHEALRERCVRIGEAAEIAGYGNPANFATAFRRHFGDTPARVRRDAMAAAPTRTDPAK